MYNTTWEVQPKTVLIVLDWFIKPIGQNSVLICPDLQNTSQRLARPYNRNNSDPVTWYFSKQEYLLVMLACI